MFNGTIELLDCYYKKHSALGTENFSPDLGTEIRERLEQMSHIVSKVKSLENIATESHRRFDASMKAHLENLKQRGVSFEDDPHVSFEPMTNEEMQRERQALFEMTLLTEAFYYFAGRVRTILKNTKFPMPGLTKFECVGVRDTRNKLLEHAEGNDSQVFTRSFGCGGVQGPVIKAIRLSTQTDIFPDAGLYVNAEEFRVNLERLLQKAIG